MFKLISRNLSWTVVLLALTVALLSRDISHAYVQYERAQELINQARAALGGEDKLKAVQSLSMTGRFRRLMPAPRMASGNQNLPPERPEMSGEVELEFLLPDKYLKAETIEPPLGGPPITLISALNGDQEWSDTKSSGGGAGLIIRRYENKEKSGQGKTLQAPMLRAEFMHYLLALLLTTPASVPIEWKYAGEAEAEDGRADALDVKGPGGFDARLFLDKQSHLPLMLSYRGMIPAVFMRRMGPPPDGKDGDKEQPDVVIKRKEPASVESGMPPIPPEVELQIRFSDYRSVDGIMLPHRITKATDGEINEEWEMKKYKVNPPLRPEKFVKK